MLLPTWSRGTARDSTPPKRSPEKCRLLERILNENKSIATILIFFRGRKWKFLEMLQNEFIFVSITIFLIDIVRLLSLNNLLYLIFLPKRTNDRILIFSIIFVFLEKFSSKIIESFDISALCARSRESFLLSRSLRSFSSILYFWHKKWQKRRRARVNDVHIFSRLSSFLFQPWQMFPIVHLYRTFTKILVSRCMCNESILFPSSTRESHPWIFTKFASIERPTSSVKSDFPFLSFNEGSDLAGLVKKIYYIVSKVGRAYAR